MIVDDDTLRQTFDAYQGNMPVDGDLVESVRSRARAHRRNRLATVGGVLCAFLLVGGVWFSQTHSSSSTNVAGEPPGKAVGERLGLEPLAFPGEGCDQWAGYEHDWGYCLDGVTNDEAELVLLSQEIYGYQMTDAPIAYVTAIIDLREYSRPETDEEIAKSKELEAIIDETKGQLEPLYQPIDINQFPGLTGEALADAAGLIPSKGIPQVGGASTPGSFGVGIGPVSYALDGVSVTEQDGEEWASRLAERNLRTAVVPEVVGLSEQEAVTVLEAAGFTSVEVDHGYSDTPKGVVSYQTQRAGSRALVDMPVRITISDGPLATSPPPDATTFVMPDLVGMTTEQALKVIRDLDIAGASVIGPDNTDGKTVVRQEPAAGTDVYEAIDNYPGIGVKIWVTNG